MRDIHLYWGKLWRREVVDNTDPALQPLIPMEQEPASVAPPEHGMEWWSNLWKMSFLNHSLKYLLCHILPAIADEIEQPIALCRACREIRAPGEWWKVRHPAPVIESDESGDDSEEEGVHVCMSYEKWPLCLHSNEKY
jgi:hypothetical protein